MYCCHCNKIIKTYEENYKMFGYDDFIHIQCITAREQEMNRIASMNELEFYDYMDVSYER